MKPSAHRIGDHVLPQELVSAIHTGAWSRGLLLPRLVEHFGAGRHEDYQFLGFHGMKADLENAKRMVAEDTAFIYAMDSSDSRAGPVRPTELDVDRGIPLICEAGEPLVWLDYRSMPAAVVMITGNPPFWATVGSSFSEFWSVLAGGGAHRGQI